MLHLSISALDYAIIASYFLVVVGIGAIARLLVKTDGAFGAHHIKVQASGINIDLWTGIGMVVVAVLMIAWAVLRPVLPEPR